MRVTYAGKGGRLLYYNCFGDRDKGQVICWSLAGRPIDEAMEKLWLETVVPDELELCLAVEHQVNEQAESLEKQWKLRMEKVVYEARFAERRYKAVDPDNRVVARTLEQDWETALREVEQVKQQCEQAKREHRVLLTNDDRQRIRQLAKDLPKVWRSKTTKRSERKAMLRLGIEAVSLTPVEVPERSTMVKVQWRSGAVTELIVPRPSSHYRTRTPKGAVKRLKELASAGLHDTDIAEQLNKEGYKTGQEKSWSIWAVRWARRKENIKRVAPDLPRAYILPDRYPDGRYSVAGAAKLFDVSEAAIRRWVRRGIVPAAQEPYKTNTNAWWLSIDQDKKQELRTLAIDSRRRSTALKKARVNR